MTKDDIGVFLVFTTFILMVIVAMAQPPEPEPIHCYLEMIQ